MKKRILPLHLLVLISILSLPKTLFSQSVGIGTTAPDPSAALDITGTKNGLLIPRMSLESINAIIKPAKGLLVYDSIANQVMINIGTAAAPNFQPVSNSNSNGWNLAGNSGTNPANQFIGTTDNQPLRFRINNIQAGELQPASGNISWGLRAGQSNTTGFSNIAIGTDALKLNTSRSNIVAIGDSALFNNSDAIFNTAIGSKALFSNTTGTNNTATGFESLKSNTTGSINTAYGVRALFSNSSGRFNSATGFSSLFSNTTGESNTATGNQSLLNNSTGNDNTATGSESLFSNTTGNTNTAMGSQSLRFNTTGGDNTAVGSGSLRLNSTGNNNTATGSLSLSFNTTGNDNTALGVQSLNANTTGGFNTATGFASLASNTTGSLNTAMGHTALLANTSGNSNTAVGFDALRNNTSGLENTAMGQVTMAGNITGNANVAIGFRTLFFTSGSNQNTVVGWRAGSSSALGFNNTLIGANANTEENDLFNCVAIGQDARCLSSSTVRLGNLFTTSIGGIVGFSNLSDGRFKKNIQESVKGVDFIMKLRPVMYQWDMNGLNQKLYAGRKTDDLSKGLADGNEKKTFSGFVAQEVEQAAKDAGYDFSGVDKPKNDNDMYGLRYAEFVVPLVKAVQEQQQMIIELKNQNADLQKRIVALEKK